MISFTDRLQEALGAGFRITTELAGGGMSRVFLAEEVALGRKVVVKVLPPEMAAGVNQDRFRREIHLAARLQHPHIVPLLSANASGDLLWYVMPFIEGESLREKLAREGELPVGEAVRLLREVTDALACAHEQGVVHRDVKPGNVMVSRGHAMVTDFGVAKAMTAAGLTTSLTSLGVALGTPAYMAPEQAAADPQLDHRADLYALGVMGYEMLTGQLPFTGVSAQAVLMAHMTQEPVPVTTHRSSVPPTLESVVMRCLQKRASDRWQSAAEIIPQLEAALTPSGGTPPTAVRLPGARSAGRRPWIAALALAMVGSIAALWFLSKRSPTSALAELDPRRVIVADFENRTGDATFDLLGATLADWVTTGVIQAGFTTVVDPLSRAAVRRVALGPDRTTIDSAFNMARVAAAGTVVSGSFTKQDNQIVIAVRISDEVRNRVLTVLDPISAPLKDPFQSAGTLRDVVAGALASALDMRINTIIVPSGRPPTYSAYQEFILGLDAFQRMSGDYDAALAHFARATTLDSTFTLPLIWAAYAHGNSGRQTQRDSVVKLLASRALPVGSLEELQLRVFLSKDLDDRLRLLQEGAARSPGSTWSHNAGVALHNFNRMREAIEYFKQVDPEHGWVGQWAPYWLYYSRALHALGEFGDELQVARRPMALGSRDLLILGVELRALAAATRLSEENERLKALVLAIADRSCVRVSPTAYATVLELRVHDDGAGAAAVLKAWLAKCEQEEKLPVPGEPNPSRGARLLWMGRALYLAARLEDAERTLRSASGLMDGAENAVGVLDVSGRIAARRGDRAGAVRSLQALSALSPLPESAILAYAAIASLLGEPELATPLLIPPAGRVQRYEVFHRDADYASLLAHPSFAQLATPN